MANTRKKGKVGEGWFVNNGLKEIWPECRRNAGSQAQSGGVDIENTNPFNVEIKYGRSYKSKMLRKVIDQAESQGRKQNFTLCLIKPDREKPYAVIPWEDFKEILSMMKAEKII